MTKVSYQNKFWKKELGLKSFGQNKFGTKIFGTKHFGSKIFRTKKIGQTFLEKIGKNDLDRKYF